MSSPDSAGPDGSVDPYATLLDNVPGCIALIVRKGSREILASNRRGREAGILPGRTCYEACAEREAPCPLCRAPVLWDDGEPQRVELKLRGSWYECFWVAASDDAYVHYFFEISERKKVEEALGESENIYRQLFDLSPVGTLMSRVDGTILEANRAAQEMLGMTMSEISERGRSGLLVPGPEVDAAVRERLKNGRYSGEVSFRRKDGSVFLADIHTVVLEDQSECQRVFVMFSDVSERKRTEETLRLIESAVNRASDMVSWADSTGRLAYVSDSMCTRLGYSRDELLHMHVWDVDPTVAGRWDEFWQQMKTERLRTFESLFRTKDGRVFPTEAAANFVEHEGKEYSLGIVRDVSERKRTERDRQITSHAIEHAGLGLIRLDKEGRIREVNGYVSSLLGYSREALLALTVFDVTMGLDPGSWPDHWVELRGQGSVTLEKEYRTKAGELIPVEISSSIVEFEGEELDHGFIRDIRDRKAAEEALRQRDEQLRQSQKMEAIGRLAGGIAHDFNNLLTAIIGYSDLLLASRGEGLEEMRNDVAEIKSAGERAASLTRQILAFSRRQTLKPVVVSLNEVVTQAERLLCRTLGEDISLETRLGVDLALVEVDPSQIDQVLMNLAVNARDAMPEGGKLTIATANVELGGDYCHQHPDVTPGPYVMLTVSDTGTGMNSETRASALEPFFTTKEQGKGTGLGLSIVYGIVSQSGGSISIESELGKGTEIQICLPCATRPEFTHASAQPGPVSPNGTETVLVVEDDPAVRALACRVLRDLGYEVLEAASGDDGYLLASGTALSLDLLLTDMVLPGRLQGSQLADAVKTVRPHLPILFMSGYSRTAVPCPADGKVGSNYLEKPFAPDALARKVREVLDRSKVGKPPRRECDQGPAAP